MKRDAILIAVVAMIVGLLGGYLIFSISNSGKVLQTNASIPAGAGSPTDYAQRIAQAEKIVAQDPKNLNVWISLGNDYFDTEQVQKAINAYGKALEIDPNNPNVLTDQGVMFKKVGWYDKALANFDKASKIAPNHLQSLYNAGIVYAIDLKQPEKALPYWNSYLKIDSNSPTALQIKGMIEQAGKPMAPVK
ncbi:MAG: tetratricopeptide repeat protein [Desulfuromonadaceae bacterium]|nr:tetratricopeptide repeat protein [Desulfuromonadaceae bacterium]MDD5107683.1 tetratricopeptide repeat protein [Desulfuromonadaceae bacterium]